MLYKLCIGMICAEVSYRKIFKRILFMKDKQERIIENQNNVPKPKNAFDLWKHVGMARSKKVEKKGKVAVDSMLATYRDKLTYTFIIDREVASIHFNRLRGEIFFKGHNIRNINLNPNQIKALKDLKNVLLTDDKGRRFFSDYDATLSRCLADNNKG